jgi:Zn-dependent protease with chaperone function
MTDPLYPPSPATVDTEKLAISPAFRRQVPKVISAIVLFMAIYLLLVIAAVALAVGCGYIGVAIIVHLTNFYGLIIGLGIFAVGISVLIFLVKFIFAVSRDVNSDRIEITEAEQPLLFAFIRRLAHDTHTPFPKKIFLSPHVNACVFYNSSFWSMFFPIRKNLEIGLGLVNSVNLSEFKAVIAHEFGHFSQKSMKLGSFTYNVNRIVYNMLYENNDYTSFLRAWGSIHSYLRFFVTITVKIAQGIQLILRGMYGVILKSYMGLSREMEFHADTVAASVSGTNNSASALSRIEVAATCYHTAVTDANLQLKHKKIALNIYPNQLIVMRTLAGEHYLPSRNGLPEFSFQFIESFTRSRINYKDQWASHPTLRERKANLERLGMPATPDDTLAWQLFDNVEALQQTMTSHLYRSVKGESLSAYDTADFESRFRQGKLDYALPKVFNGFYDDRFIEINDWDIDTLAAEPAPSLTASQLFSEENGRLQSTLESNKQDLEILKAIQKKKIPITSFDFDGVKHSVGDCDALITQLQQEVGSRAKHRDALDKTAFQFFLSRDNINKDLLKTSYRHFQKTYDRTEEFVALVNRLIARIRPLYTQKLTVGQVTQLIAQLKATEEAALKKAYNRILDEQLLDENLLPSSGDILSFLQKQYAYFISGNFQNNELNDLTGLATKTAEQLNQLRFNAYKSMLELQAGSLKTSMTSDRPPSSPLPIFGYTSGDTK